MLKTINMLCKNKNLSLAELERQSGVPKNSIYRWDIHKPSVDKVKRVADFFGVTVDSLLNDDSAETG